MRANHHPLVPHIALFPANLAPSMDIATAISSSHWKNVISFFTFHLLISHVTTSIIEDAGVIGYALYRHNPLAIAHFHTISFPKYITFGAQIFGNAPISLSVQNSNHSFNVFKLSSNDDFHANSCLTISSHSANSIQSNFIAYQNAGIFLNFRG
jgi:hypothetical protein